MRQGGLSTSCGRRRQQPSSKPRVWNQPLRNPEPLWPTENSAFGPLTADAPTPAWNSYLLTVACAYGVVFQQWVTPLDAEMDLICLRLNSVEEADDSSRR